MRLEEIDIAGIVFFVRFSSYVDEAMECFLAGLEGGYAALLATRKICFSTVRMDSTFGAPLR